MDESHLADVGYYGESHCGMEAEAAGPIDEESTADEVLTGHDSFAVGFVIACAEGGPKAGIVAEATVVAEDEEFIGTKFEGIAFGGSAGSSAEAVSAAIVYVAVKHNVLQAECTAGSGDADRGQGGGAGLAVVAPFSGIVGSVPAAGFFSNSQFEAVIDIGEGDGDGPTRREGLEPLLSELGAGAIIGFIGDGAGSVEVDPGAVGASVLSQSNGELAPGAVGCKDEGKFQVADRMSRVGAGAVIGAKATKDETEPLGVELHCGWSGGTVEFKTPLGRVDGPGGRVGQAEPRLSRAAAGVGIGGLIIAVKGLDPKGILNVLGLALDLTIDVNVTVDDLDGFVGASDEAFDIVFVGIIGVLENDDVPGLRLDELIEIL